MEVPGGRLPGARMVGGGRGEAGGGAEGATSKGSQAHSVAFLGKHLKTCERAKPDEGEPVNLITQSKIKSIVPCSE